MERTSPPGFSTKQWPTPEIVHERDGSGAASRQAQNIPAFEARAMQLANSQLAAVGQTCFFLYMFVGNQLSLISVYMMLTMGTGPMRNIFNVKQAFTTVEAPGVKLLIPKLIFIALNAVGVLFLLWKLRSSGLLPVTSADWFALIPHRTPLEHVSLAADATS